MSDPTLIASAAVLIIGALAGGIVSIIKALSSMRIEVLSKFNDAHITQEKIHQEVNGNASIAEERLVKLEIIIANLNAKMSELQEEKIKDNKTFDVICPRLDEVTRAFKEHDDWEREERIEIAKLINENTNLTQRIHDLMGKSK